MSRLHEYQGKAILAEHGLNVPEGRVARTPDEAADAAESLGGRVVLKAQAWVTGRAAKGGIQFADSPAEAAAHAEQLLTLRFGNFPVTEVLIERAVGIREEFFVSLSIDDAAMAPVLLLAHHGGSGIEERADAVHRLPVDVANGVDSSAVRAIVDATNIEPIVREPLAEAIAAIPRIARTIEARSLEINPLVTTDEGRVMAADCRVTIDDYAVFRHSELGIEIARELDHPATELEKVAYAVEQADHRGTFYFAQLPTDGAESDRIIGFHGAGGGGSMMSMDAVTNEGFTLANFCDTSGNPSAAKVYRAARIILSQPGLVGYFGSGSGVASQEQYHSAYGLAKAFIEVDMPLPVVVRLGGNSEDRAVRILEDACKDLPATIEGYKKDDTPAFCAERFAELVDTSRDRQGAETKRRVPDFVGNSDADQFPITGGTVWIDSARCDAATAQRVADLSDGLLTIDESTDRLTPTIDAEELAKKDSEFIALEIECRRAEMPVVFVDLEIPGLAQAAG